MNDNTVLPRLILVIPDIDLLNHIDCDQLGFGMKTTATAAIDWIVTQMIRAMDEKKDHMRCRKPGSLAPCEPKFIWTKMIFRPGGDKTITVKYNSIMEQCLASKSCHYIMDLNNRLSDESLFDSRGELNGHGRVKFWVEIDKTLERFDKQIVSLKPEYKRQSQEKEPLTSKYSNFRRKINSKWK